MGATAGTSGKISHHLSCHTCKLQCEFRYETMNIAQPTRAPTTGALISDTTSGRSVCFALGRGWGWLGSAAVRAGRAHSYRGESIGSNEAAPRAGQAPKATPISAEGPSDSDLARALRDGDEHDAHDADPADEAHHGNAEHGPLALHGAHPRKFLSAVSVRVRLVRSIRIHNRYGWHGAMKASATRSSHGPPLGQAITVVRTE